MCMLIGYVINKIASFLFQHDGGGGKVEAAAAGDGRFFCIFSDKYF